MIAFLRLVGQKAASSWVGYMLTGIAATTVTAGGVILLGGVELVNGVGLGGLATLPFSFQVQGITSIARDLYGSTAKPPAAALSREGVVLPDLGLSAASKITNVSSKIITEAVQDNVALTKVQQASSQLTSFKNSSDTTQVLKAAIASQATPTPSNGPSAGPTLPPVGGNEQSVALVAPQAVNGSAGQQTPGPGSAATPGPGSSATSVAAPTAASTAAATDVATVAPTIAATTLPTPVATVAPTSVPTVAITAVPTLIPATPSTVPVSPTAAMSPTQPVPTAPAPTAPPAPTDTPAPTNTPVPTIVPTLTSTPQTLSITATNSGQALLSFSGMIPGDSIAHPITITNNGQSNFTYALTTSCSAGCGPGQSGLLWTDSSNGLQLLVTRGATVLYSGPIQASNIAMGVTVAPGQTDSLNVTVKLPASAGNQFGSLSTTVTFTWAAKP